MTALITGASRGIGSAIAYKLKEQGYTVLTPSRNQMDLLSNRSIDSYLSEIKTSVDILINNAGINQLVQAAEISDKSISETLQVNLIAPIRITGALIPYMVKRKYGRIVNISSIWSRFTRPGRLLYSVSKSGLSAATRTWAVELATHNILVNAVAPGFADTEMTRQNNNLLQIKKLIKSLPIKRLARPEEIAEVVAFLASEKNTYITGQTVFVDGGFSCV